MARQIWLALALALVCVAGASAPAFASSDVEYGISDGRPALFDAPQVTEVNFTHVRLVLPWNAAYQQGSWTTWLQRAGLQGYPVMIAPSIDTPHDCNTGTCTGPSAAAYRAALSALLDAYPQIDAVEGWNEPNHALQPTRSDPAAAAGYFNVAAQLCVNRCTAVAGNFLDAPGFLTYLNAYKAGLTTTPAVWGLHNYYDATYFQSTGVDTMLANTTGQLWLTETGGIVAFNPNGAALPGDEHHAADSLRWIFNLSLNTPRIARTYLYMLWQQPSNGFDSALLRADGTERESMGVVRQFVGPRKVALAGPEAPITPPFQATKLLGDPIAPTAAAAALTTSGAMLRVVGKRVVLGKRARRVSVALRCVSAQPCHSRVEVRVGSWGFARNLTVRAGGGKHFHVRLERSAANGVSARVSSTAWARTCPTVGSCTASPQIALIRR